MERDRTGAAAPRAAQGLWRWGSRGDGGVGILLTAEADVQNQVYDTIKHQELAQIHLTKYIIQHQEWFFY